MEQEISFNEFTRRTRHKKVAYRWTEKNGVRVKEFQSDRFYCNKDSRIKMLSMPRFMLSSDTKFYESNGIIIGVSEFGTTEFRVMESN